jgi:hypothetical protein
MAVNGYEISGFPSFPGLRTYRGITGPAVAGQHEQEFVMVYLWRYADEAGVVAEGPAVEFGSQEAAESWLTETYNDLLDEGITAVSLFNDQQAVYGPMALAE